MLLENSGGRDRPIWRHKAPHRWSEVGILAGVCRQTLRMRGQARGLSSFVVFDGSKQPDSGSSKPFTGWYEVVKRMCRL